MSQFLRPDGNITSANIASGGYTAIDETSPNDSDYIETNNVDFFSIPIFECSLSNPSSAPTKPVTIRWRAYRFAGGSQVQVTVRFLQGATELDVYSTNITGSPATYEWEPDITGVTDWDDLRIRWSFIPFDYPFTAASRLTWAELEAPPVATYNETISETLTASDSFAAAATINTTVSESVTGADSFAPAATINAAVSEILTAADLYGLIYDETISETLTASDSFLGGTDYYQTISESLTASDAYAATVTEPNGWIIPAPPTDGWIESGASGGAWTEVSDTDTDWTEI